MSAVSSVALQLGVLTAERDQLRGRLESLEGELSVAGGESAAELLLAAAASAGCVAAAELAGEAVGVARGRAAAERGVSATAAWVCAEESASSLLLLAPPLPPPPAPLAGVGRRVTCLEEEVGLLASVWAVLVCLFACVNSSVAVPILQLPVL